MKKTLTTLALAGSMIGLALCASAAGSGAQDGQLPSAKARKVRQPKIDLVIALDTSGSMSGLINAARQKLWDIVNEAARAQPAPRLRVGLVTFGSQGSEDDGYVVVRSDLTTDLDAIYSKLFELRTSGGTEYVGRVVYRATRELGWDQDQRTLKQIFVAGNESADQDRRVSARRAVKLARRRGIFVNAIYCGRGGSSEADGWRAVATRGSGVFASIDHNRGTINVATPYDRKLNELSAKLNATYVAYGPRGGARRARQEAQDDNASRSHASAGAARAVAKASPIYRNEGWDLVDARKAGKRVAKRALPAKLRRMSDKDREAYLDKMEGKRDALRKQIRELSKKRRSFIAKKMKKMSKGKAERSFDTAIRSAVRKQAAMKGIAIE